jgi:hypothetical protein
MWFNQFHSVSGAYSVMNFGVWDSVSQSPILILLFGPFVTGCSKSEWAHMGGDLAVPTLLPLYKSLSAQSSSVFNEVRLVAVVMGWDSPSII